MDNGINIFFLLLVGSQERNMNTTKKHVRSASADDLQELKDNPLIREFAAVKPETYELIKATNPMLLIFLDFAKKIVEEVV